MNNIRFFSAKIAKLVAALKRLFQPLELKVRSCTSIKEANKAAARKFRAGSKTIMTSEERQAFLRDSEYGRLAGVSHFFGESNREDKSLDAEKQSQIAEIKMNNPDFSDEDAEAYLIFLSIEKRRSDLYKRLTDE